MRQFSLFKSALNDVGSAKGITFKGEVGKRVLEDYCMDYITCSRTIDVTHAKLSLNRYKTAQ